MFDFDPDDSVPPHPYSRPLTLLFHFFFPGPQKMFFLLLLSFQMQWVIYGFLNAFSPSLLNAILLKEF